MTRIAGGFRGTGRGGIVRLTIVGMIVGALLVACGDDGPTGVEAPEGHTVRFDGAAHAPGFNDPGSQCAECHGTNLRGGDDGEPSCFSCHGQVWG